MPAPSQLLACPSQQHLPAVAGVRLRVATHDDLDALAGLKRRVETATYGHLATPAALAVRHHRRCTAWFLRTLLAKGDLLLVAEQDQGLVGMAAAAFRPGPLLRLHSAYVETPGLGLGRLLTTSRLEEAHRRGIDAVSADSFVGVPAAAARLAALGMVQTGRSPSPTFPGVDVLHWSGKVEVALERATTKEQRWAPAPPPSRT